MGFSQKCSTYHTENRAGLHIYIKMGHLRLWQDGISLFGLLAKQRDRFNGLILSSIILEGQRKLNLSNQEWTRVGLDPPLFYSRHFLYYILVYAHYLICTCVRI